MGGAMCKQPSAHFDDDEEDNRDISLAENQPQALVVSSSFCLTLDSYQVIMITAVSSRSPTLDGLNDDARMLAYVIRSRDSLDYMIVPLHPDNLRTFGSIVCKSALDVYGKMRQLKSRKKKNFVFSPMYVMTTLAVVYSGAKRNTKSELKSAFYLYAFDNKEHLHVALEDINYIIEMIRRYCELRTVSRLYVQEECPLQEEFLNTVIKYPKTDIKQVDFVNNAKAIEEEMKEWLTRETDNKLTETIDVESGQFTHLSKLVLVSAITFRGKWVTPFNKEETTMMKFGPNSDTETKVDMMHQRGRFFFGYIDELDCDVLELPCRLDCVSMIILLPANSDGLDTLEKKLSHAHLQSLNRYTTKQIVDVTIPRFTLADSFNLKEILRSMNVTSVFEPGTCDLSGIGNGNTDLFLSEIFHHAQVQVTDQTMDPISGDIDHTTNEDEKHKVFLANHPFIFLVRDNTRTGTILFMGRMVNPN